MNKRIQKRWKRENRTNKGANTEARRIEHNRRVREERALSAMPPFERLMFEELMRGCA